METLCRNCKSVTQIWLLHGIPVVKIASWNCQGGLAKKVDRIFWGHPNVAIIQECSELAARQGVYEGYESLWFGDGAKGLAFFLRRDWKLKLIEKPDQNLIVPLEVRAPENFTLVTVGACAVGSKRRSYVSQIHESLEQHFPWFASGPTVVASDFNSNAIWDRERALANHSTMVSALAGYGLICAYHASTEQKHGKETTATFHISRNCEKGYHMDYMFIPVDWMSRLTPHVGTHAEWSGVSD